MMAPWRWKDRRVGLSLAADDNFQRNDRLLLGGLRKSDFNPSAMGLGGGYTDRRVRPINHVRVDLELPLEDWTKGHMSNLNPLLVGETDTQDGPNLLLPLTVAAADPLLFDLRCRQLIQLSPC